MLAQAHLVAAALVEEVQTSHDEEQRTLAGREGDSGPVSARYGYGGAYPYCLAKAISLATVAISLTSRAILEGRCVGGCLLVDPAADSARSGLGRT